MHFFLRIISSLLAALVLTVLAAIPAAAQKNSRGSNPDHTLLWEISGKGMGQPSYLYGTMHIRDKRVFDFSDSVLIAFNNCSALATELVMDSMMGSILTLASALIDESFDLRKAMSKKDWALLDKAMKAKSNISADDIRYMKPWVVRMMLATPGGSSDDQMVVVDQYFDNLAKTKKMPIQGIERVAEQIALFDMLPATEQVKGLVADLRNREKPSKDIERMIGYYRDGMLDSLLPMMNDPSWGEKFYEKFLIDRNHIMAERIPGIIAGQPTFVAVGAGHLPGPEGVIALLRAQGYSVRPVRPVYTGKAQELQAAMMKSDWSSFTLPDGGLTVQVPTTPTKVIEQEIPGGGELSLYMASDIFGGVNYMLLLMSVDSDDGTVDETATDAAVEAFLENAKAKIVEEKPFTISGVAGRDLLVTIAEQGWGRVLLIPRGNRMYMAMAVTKTREAIVSSAGRFFESLKLADVKE